MNFGMFPLLPSVPPTTHPTLWRNCVCTSWQLRIQQTHSFRSRSSASQFQEAYLTSEWKHVALELPSFWNCALSSSDFGFYWWKWSHMLSFSQCNLYNIPVMKNWGFSFVAMGPNSNLGNGLGWYIPKGDVTNAIDQGHRKEGQREHLEPGIISTIWGILPPSIENIQKLNPMQVFKVLIPLFPNSYI